MLEKLLGGKRWSEDFKIREAKQSTKRKGKIDISTIIVGFFLTWITIKQQLKTASMYSISVSVRQGFLKQLCYVALAQGLSWGCRQDVNWDCHPLEAGLGWEGPRGLLWPQFLMAIRKRPQLLTTWTFPQGFLSGFRTWNLSPKMKNLKEEATVAFPSSLRSHTPSLPLYSLEASHVV